MTTQTTNAYNEGLERAARFIETHVMASHPAYPHLRLIETKHPDLARMKMAEAIRDLKEKP